MLPVQERFTEWTGAATPVPVRVADVGEFDALLTKDAVIEASPLACGMKVTLKLTLCPAAIVTGNERPLIENSEPPRLTEVTVTLDPVAESAPL